MHLIKLLLRGEKTTESEHRILNRCVNAANYLLWNCLAENCQAIITGCLKYQDDGSENIYTALSLWGLNSESASYVCTWNRINIWSFFCLKLGFSWLYSTIRLVHSVHLDYFEHTFSWDWNKEHVQKNDVGGFPLDALSTVQQPVASNNSCCCITKHCNITFILPLGFQKELH